MRLVQRDLRPRHGGLGLTERKLTTRRLPRGGLLALPLLLVTAAATAEAVTYRVRQDPNTVFDEAGRAVVATDFYASTRCEAFTREPARFGITGVVQLPNGRPRVEASIDGEPIEPDVGQYEVPWRAAPLPEVGWVAQARVDVHFERRTGDAFVEEPNWFPNPFHQMGSTCPPLLPKLEPDVVDAPSFRLHASETRTVAATDPEPAPTPAPGPLGAAAASAAVFRRLARAR